MVLVRLVWRSSMNKKTLTLRKKIWSRDISIRIVGVALLILEGSNWFCTWFWPYYWLKNLLLSTCVFIISHAPFRLKLHSAVAWMLSDCNRIQTHNLLVPWISIIRQLPFIVYFTLKGLQDLIKTHYQMHHTDKYSQHSSIIKIIIKKNKSKPVCLNGWVFVY